MRHDAACGHAAGVRSFVDLPKCSQMTGVSKSSECSLTFKEVLNFGFVLFFDGGPRYSDRAKLEGHYPPNLHVPMFKLHNL